MLQFANLDILLVPDSLRSKRERWSRTNITNSVEFGPIFESTMKDLITNASTASPHFASAVTKRTLVERFFSYAQCNPVIDNYNCYACLDHALSLMKECCRDRQKAVVFKPSCQLRLDANPFLNETFFNEIKSPSPADRPASPPKRAAIIGAIVASVLFVGISVLLVVMWIHLRPKKRKETSNGLPPTSPSGLLDGYDPIKPPLLDWTIRKQIIIGIANGLHYLHEGSRLTIIQHDLKPDNILLDKKIKPKITDFGLAKLFEDAQKFGCTMRISRTLGYMAPEYKIDGEYSEKFDAYSFGIMILEIVSGKKNSTFFKTSELDLPLYAWRLLMENQSFNLIDPVIAENCSSNDVRQCIEIGLLCLQADAKERPNMGYVITMLTNPGNLPLPTAPATAFPRPDRYIAYKGVQPSHTDQSSSTKSSTQDL